MSIETHYAAKSGDYYANARTEIASLLPERAARVLEIGCGSGGTMRWLRGQREVAYAHGMELMPEAAELARGVFDRVECGNIEAMPLPDGPFDLILALDVLEHLVDPWAMVAALHQRLAPGGCIVVSLPNVAHISVAMPLLLSGSWPYADEGLLDRTHLRFFTPETALALMTGSGCRLDRLERVISGPLFLKRLSQANRWYALKLLRLVLPLRLLTFQFLIRVVAPG